MRVLTLFTILLFLAATSCLNDDIDSIGSEQSPMGEVGNTFTITGLNLPGVAGISASITALDNGVSTVTASATVTDDNLIDIAELVAAVWPGSITVSGNTVSGSGKARFTKEGIAGVFPEGDLILVHYDAEPGDSWSLNTGGRTITNKVISRSTEDDYYWGGWLIKVIEIEGSGHNIAGVDKITYYANHRFGIVGANATLSNSTILSAAMSSSATN